MTPITQIQPVMSPEERQQFAQMQQEIASVKKEVTGVKDEVSGIGKKVDKLLMYVVGDENSRDISMLSRIRDLEKELEDRKKEYLELKEDRSKDSIYIKIMWTMAGAIGMGLLGVIVYWIKGQ